MTSIDVFNVDARGPYLHPWNIEKLVSYWREGSDEAGKQVFEIGVCINVTHGEKEW